MRSEYICTKNDPWNKDIPTPVRHPEAECIASEDNYFESWDKYKCPYCGIVFKIRYDE